MVKNHAFESGIARRPYRLVSADQHVNEPPDLWTSRVSAKFRDRVPHMTRFQEGDAWIIEGVPDPINFGMNCCAGLKAEDFKPWLRWEQVRSGGYVGQDRVRELAVDGVDAAILFPTPRLSEGIITNPDRELQLMMIRAYNDWLSEYVACAPDRLFGMISLPATGVADAIAEFERCIERPGMIGPVISRFPHGTATVSDEDDPLWEVLSKADIPIDVHFRLMDAKPTKIMERITGSTRNKDAERLMLEFLWAGVLDRFPDLKVVFTEVDVGWVPFFKEQVDNRYHRLNTAGKFNLRMPPSEYFDRHFYYSFVTDAYGIRNREAVGIKNMMWSDDYPHLGGDWPYTQRSLPQYFSDVPREQRELIQAGNATRLYHLPGLPA